MEVVYGINFVIVVMCGYKVWEIFVDKYGDVDLVVLKVVVGLYMAGFMMMNLLMCGVFECEIKDIVKVVYEVGGLLYYDGVNFNVILGKVCFGDMGFDVLYMNLYKIFVIFYGGGGFGVGFVGVGERLLLYFLILIVGKEEIDGKV